MDTPGGFYLGRNISVINKGSTPGGLPLSLPSL
jgi:hypothetical protein